MLSEPHSKKVKGDSNPVIAGYTDGFGYVLASAAVAFFICNFLKASLGPEAM